MHSLSNLSLTQFIKLNWLRVMQTFSIFLLYRSWYNCYHRLFMQSLKLSRSVGSGEFVALLCTVNPTQPAQFQGLLFSRFRKRKTISKILFIFVKSNLFRKQTHLENFFVDKIFLRLLINGIIGGELILNYKFWKPFHHKHKSRQLNECKKSNFFFDSLKESNYNIRFQFCKW